VVTAVYPWLMMVVLVDAALFIDPLLVFTNKLWVSKLIGF
jgi:hypothetical protein